MSRSALLDRPEFSGAKPLGAPAAGPAAGTSGHDLAGSFLETLRLNAAADPDGMVYRFMSVGGEQESLSNRALAQWIGRYAGAIRAMHNSSAEEPSKIVLLLPQGKDFVAAFFACIAAEAIAVPSFPPKNQAQADRLKLVLMDLAECIVLADRDCLLNEVAELRKDPELARVSWIDIEELAQAPVKPLHEFSARPEAIAMLQYTSGSTGVPRGVMVSNRNMVENSELIKQAFGHQRPDRRSVIWLPPYHDMGLIGGVLQAVHAAYPALLMPTSLFVRHPLRWLKAIEEFRGTSSGGPNFAFQMCVDSVRERDLARLDLSSWDIAFCGAEPISHETMVAFSRKFAAAGFRPSAIYPCYGMAETTLMVSGKHYLEDMRSLYVDAHALAHGHVSLSRAEAPGSRALVSCGAVHPSLDLRIVDPQLGIERAQREIGELWVSGPSVTQGYWNHVEKTLQTFDQPLAGRAQRYLRTGDLGFIEQGQLYVTGRIKEVLIVRGANHYPQDIEQECALACPEFVNCRAGAFAVPGLAHEQVVIALEVPRVPIEHDQIAQRINKRLVEKFGIHADVILFVPRKTIKTTTSGKLQRLALRNDYLSNKLPNYHVWQQAPTAPEPAALTPFSAASVEDVLQWITQRIATITRLEPGRIHPDDSFADLALDSVASLEIVSELDHQHGIGVAPEALYTHNTPMLLATEIFKLAQAMLPTTQESRSC
ncbi:AMP-binding protein [Paucibacter sp. APW11]|uniref:AMP-binding protein n=1 Tax=Roseateles aquae TaxID=3077235 RepID=A0ABU3P590_9BURK|nr:AMP-binding protein [Paucibacter sp. APW11]MDT8997743.1 AMP-binding protein [Paucibacter sp. APW11]